MAYARTENGIVVEVIAWEPEGRYHPDVVAAFIPAPDEVEVGWSHADGVFAPPPVDLEAELAAARMDALSRIDQATSAAIMAGFDAQAVPQGADDPETLHFSYDATDQQNFVDAAVAMQLGARDAIPKSTPWNAYRAWTPETGGELVVLLLTAETFLPLYAAALNHKAEKLAEGGARKARVNAAESAEDVRGMLAEWGL